MLPSKIKAYIGFAIKSRSLVFGLDNMDKKKLKLILVSQSLSQNSLGQATKLKEKNNCELLSIADEDMQYLLDKDNVKAIAVLNPSLAEAIAQSYRGIKIDKQ